MEDDTDEIELLNCVDVILVGFVDYRQLNGADRLVDQISQRVLRVLLVLVLM